MSLSAQQNATGDDVPKATIVDADARKLDDEAIGGGLILDGAKGASPAKLPEVITHFHLE
jgi:hypothetical protein